MIKFIDNKGHSHEIITFNHIKNGLNHQIAILRDKISLVWQSVRSCFGSGGWDNDLPWDNDDGWNNG